MTPSFHHRKARRAVRSGHTQITLRLGPRWEKLEVLMRRRRNGSKKTKILATWHLDQHPTTG